MRLFNKWALVGVAALFALASCEQIREVNPEYNAKTGEVNTKFAFSIATGQGYTVNTKAYETGLIPSQMDGAFLGMKDMTLVTLTGHPAEASLFSRNFALSSLAVGEINNLETDAANASKVYNLSIPLGTDNMLFYGKSIKNDDITSADNNIKYGATIFGKTISATGKFADSKANTNFSLKQIQNDAVKYTQVTNAIDAILNHIITAQANLGTVDAPVLVNWVDLKTTAPYKDDNAFLPFIEALDNLYIREGEFRAGSGLTILRSIEDLYKMMDVMAEDESGNPDGVIAMATAIETIIGYYTEYNSNQQFVFKSPSSIATNTMVPERTLFNGLSTGDLNNFPTNLNLPYGAAQLNYNSTTKKFEHATAPDPLRATGIDITKFVFPSELCYVASSTLRTSEDEVVTVDSYPKKLSEWNAETWATRFGTWAVDQPVKSTTRGVALKNNVQYANALLETKIAYNVASDVTGGGDEVYVAGMLYDNTKHFFPGEENLAIDITSVPKFKVTGILIGGQPEQVSFNFAPAGGYTDYNYVVYDQFYPEGNGKPANGIVITAGSNGTAGPFYTMVLDNVKSNADGTVDGVTQNDVYIAIELVNNSGKDFWGKDNLIRNGGTFYLAAKLPANDPGLNSVLSNYPVNDDGNGHRYPPVEVTGTTHANIPVARIFMEDYKTTANLKIGPTSLQNAYATVPDLRSVEMTFGLSVDLTWQAGATFNIDL